MSKNIDDATRFASDLAIAALLRAQETRLAELSAPAATPKAESKSRAKASKAPKAPKAPKAIRGSQGADASGFSVYRGTRATGPGWVSGVAGNGSEVAKMRDSLARHLAIALREARDATVAAEAAELVAAELAETDDVGTALASEESVLQRGMAAIKLDLASTIRAELDSNDVGKLKRRYDSLGESVTETTIAVEFGSMPGAKLGDDGESVEPVAGTPYAPESSIANLLALHPELRKAVARAEQK